VRVDHDRGVCRREGTNNRSQIQSRPFGQGRVAAAVGTAVNPATVLLSGLSAALLLAAWLYPDYRYLSVVALAPLLVGLSRGRVNEGLALGFFFGIFFFAVRSLDILSGDLIVVLRQGLVGTFVLTIFSGLAAWSVQRYGLNAVTVAVFWVFVEPALVALGLEGGLFRPLVDSTGVVHRLALTFGLAVVSTAVILLNVLLILAIDKVAKRAKVRPPDISVDERNWDLKSAAGLLAQKLFSVPESRGPPGVLLTG